MYLIISSMICYIIAVVFIYLPFLIPSPLMTFFTYIGIIIAVVPNILLWQRIMASDTYRHVERQPKWKHLIDYIRRDNHMMPIFGDRAYPGESFLDVPQLGLIEFLGKDCYYNWGDKKILFGLENINYSPDIRYSNLCHILWELGFKNSADVKKVLTGEDLFLMGKVYLNMVKYDGDHGAAKFVTLGPTTVNTNAIISIDPLFKNSNHAPRPQEQHTLIGKKNGKIITEVVNKRELNQYDRCFRQKWEC